MKAPSAFMAACVAAMPAFSWAATTTYAPAASVSPPWLGIATDPRARPLGDRIHLGLALEASQLALGSSTITMTTAGLGGLYQWLPSLRLGASYLNLGLSSDAGAAPAVLRLGLDWQPLGQALQLATEYMR